jgi:RNA polymerase sigma factor (sigma-70 family)
MRFLKCPRCRGKSFECFSMYGICHDCNYFEVKRNRQVPDEKIKKRKTDYQVPSPFRRGDGQDSENGFTDQDHQIVRKALLSIPEREQRVVFLYFWKDQKQQEIAEKLRMTGEQVEAILHTAYSRLKALCLREPRFSRGLRALQEVA